MLWYGFVVWCLVNCVMCFGVSVVCGLVVACEEQCRVYVLCSGVCCKVGSVLGLW